MRFASDIKNHMGYPGVPEAVQSIEEQLDKKQYIKHLENEISGILNEFVRNFKTNLQHLYPIGANM